MRCIHDSSSVCDLYEYYGNRPCDICDYCRDRVYKPIIRSPQNSNKNDEVDLNIDLTEFYNFDVEEPVRKVSKSQPIKDIVYNKPVELKENESIWKLLWNFFFGWLKK